MTNLIIRSVAFILWPLFLSGQATVFKANSNLQSIAVRVTDKKGYPVPNLSASDFTLLEGGRPQRIAFFETSEQPVSIAVLVDTSRSMDFGEKLNRTQAFLTWLLRGNLQRDEIFLMPFSDTVGPFEQVSMEQRLRPLAIPSIGHRGSALYDALASGLCHMRSAKNIRQAVVIITDGVDEHSRLRLEQLLDLVRSSNPQVFLVGLYSKTQKLIFQQHHKTVTIVGLREIDNPILVFNRLAKESGAEAFFPSSDEEFGKVLNRIFGILQSQYTLAYYPERVDKIRRIEVKVSRIGLTVTTRENLGSEAAPGQVHFTSASCEISVAAHPYPWESHLTSTTASPIVYREDFSDPHSGWPALRFDSKTSSSSHYVKGGYELYHWSPPIRPALTPANGEAVSTPDSLITAYGPLWQRVRLSARIQGIWNGPDNTRDASRSATGIVFELSEQGYYAFLINGGASDRILRFCLIRGRWNGTRTPLVPWTSAPLVGKARTTYRLAVACYGGRIALQINGKKLGEVDDQTLHYGLVGLAVFGRGRLFVDSLQAEAMR